MNQRRLFFLSLGLGALLLGPIQAQKPAELAPKGTFAVVRFSSLNWFQKAKNIMAEATGDDPESMDLPLLPDLHDMGGVDRDKPFYVFLVKGLQPTPWFALPVKDPDAFQKGMKIPPPAKPILKGSYGLLSPGTLMGGGNVPEFGVPEIGSLPEMGLTLRILGPQTMAAFAPQLMQIQMMGGMIAQMQSKGDPKKAQAIGNAINLAFDLVKSLQVLDFGVDLSSSGSAKIRLSATPVKGSSLANLVQSLKPSGLPPVLGKNAALWLVSALPPTKSLPKKFQEVFQGLFPSPGGAKENPLAGALSNCGSIAATLTPEGRLVLGIVAKVEDPKIVKPYLESKEKFAELTDKLVSKVPLSGSSENPLAPILGILHQAEFHPAALEVGGQPAAGLTLPLAEVLKEADPGDPAALRKLLGGEQLHGLSALVGDKVFLGLGPEGLLQGLFKGLGTTAAVPALSTGTLIAGAFNMGDMVKVLASLRGKPLRKGLKLSDLPAGKIRFSLENNGKAFQAGIGGNTNELLQVVRFIQKLH